MTGRKNNRSYYCPGEKNNNIVNSIGRIKAFYPQV
jgi:hypothetical protein